MAIPRYQARGVRARGPGGCGGLGRAEEAIYGLIGSGPARKTATGTRNARFKAGGAPTKDLVGGWKIPPLNTSQLEEPGDVPPPPPPTDLGPSPTFAGDLPLPDGAQSTTGSTTHSIDLFTFDGAADGWDIELVSPPDPFGYGR